MSTTLVFFVDMATIATPTSVLMFFIVFVLCSSNDVFAIRIGTNACAIQNDAITLLKGFEDWTLTFQYKANGQGTLLSIEHHHDNQPIPCFAVGIGNSGNLNLPTVSNWTSVTIVYKEGQVIHGETKQPLLPCSSIRLFLGCTRNNPPLANFNASIAHVRLFAYALSKDELAMVNGTTLNRDLTCALEVDAPLSSVAEIGVERTFNKFNTNAALAADLSEPTLKPGNVMLGCPQVIVNRCGALACHECVVSSKHQRQCKMCDNYVCRPASTACPLLGACPAENSAEFCAKILDTCISSCNTAEISTCRCDKQFLHIGCPANGTCLVSKSWCQGQCGSRPVVSCDCVNPMQASCGAVQTEPEMSSRGPATKPADIIAIAIGVGGAVFCVCFIVVIVLIVKVYRVRKLESERITTSTKSSSQQRQTEAMSLNSLGVNMTSVRSARPSIATAPAFVCSFCPQVFPSSVDLQLHLRTHDSANASDNVYGDLSVAPPKSDHYDRVELSTNGDLREVVVYDSTLPELALTRDSRHAEPMSVDPSLPGYRTKPDEFAKFQIEN